ncbi:MAG: hypothetical protein KDC79_05690 [Cyclobacteriaceae bacterium]|nr:hypothetical protein [Cyclobacteriaceae bacterium]
MALITKKKILFPVNEALRSYLNEHERSADAIEYEELIRYKSSIPLYDSNGVDTLWETVLFSPADMESIHRQLKLVYANLTSSGNVEVIEHLFIDRIDICPFGNTKPFRVRIVNRINDNFDYFYIKKADASRIYGLELEHLLSPNAINYLVFNNTLVEEHIAGVPGDQFMKRHIHDEFINKVRLSKEFVKFNERCFVRLLGDMHSSNFVVDVTPDFEDTHYRIRAIDFDQQSYEARKAVYYPKYFKQNNPFIKMGMEVMTPESMHQYQLEERTLIHNRSLSNKYALNDLLDAMCTQPLSIEKNIVQLGKELAEHHNDPQFTKCSNMGELVKLNLSKSLEKTD